MNAKTEQLNNFSQPLLQWFDNNGRHNLPWQHPRSAYRVWVSEIMLQQTQVVTVIGYFERFMQRFPDVKTLAEAPDDAVMACWSGLGYYSRARNLHRAAQILMSNFNGEFPQTITELTSLPGIGATTAAAIAAQAFNLPHSILDGNVKRVLSRFFMIGGEPQKSATLKILWQLAELCMPAERCADYTQAIMDLGALCCTSKNPACTMCPLKIHCKAFEANLVADYPQKKKRSPVPIKEEQFLLFCKNKQEIYLEKRPDKGIWGGLWCLPALTEHQDHQRYIQEKLGTDSAKPKKLPVLKHRFTHYQLNIQPWLYHIPAHNLLKETQGQWFNPEELAHIGIASPVQQLINENFLENILPEEEFIS